MGGETLSVTSTHHRRIPNSLAAPATARRYVAQVLAGECSDLLDAVVLMVSELATNCVLHADSDLVVSVERAGGEVRIDVADDDPSPVARRDPRPDEATGRGLRIVDELADEWGVRESRDRHGKSVWFTVRA